MLLTGHGRTAGRACEWENAWHCSLPQQCSCNLVSCNAARNSSIHDNISKGCLVTFGISHYALRTWVVLNESLNRTAHEAQCSTAPLHGAVRCRPQQFSTAQQQLPYTSWVRCISHGHADAGTTIATASLPEKGVFQEQHDLRVK